MDCAASLRQLKYLHVRPWSCLITDGCLTESLPEVTHLAIHVPAENAQEVLDLASVDHMCLYLTPLNISIISETGLEVEADLVVRSNSAMQWLRLHVPSSVDATIDMQRTNLSYHLSGNFNYPPVGTFCVDQRGTCPDSLPKPFLALDFPEPQAASRLPREFY